MNLDVSRGNCPCSVRQARELDDGCDRADVSCPSGLFAEVRVPTPRPAQAPVRFDPADLTELYGGTLEDVFLLVASPAIRESLSLSNSTGVTIEELAWHGPQSRAALVDALAEHHRSGRGVAVLWIADDEFEHFLDEQLVNARMAAISFFSTGFTASRLENYLRVLRAADYRGELRRESALLKILDQARKLEFHTPAFGTSAVFEHQRALHWFSLNGGLSRGQQTVLPTGELSALTDASGRFSMGNPFKLNGELVFYGAPIVHRGSRLVSVEETTQAYQAFAPMRRHPAIVRVEDGLITSVRAPSSALGNDFTRALETLFASDERYRKVHEIGFGTNTACVTLEPENFFPNERWPGVHFGLGLGGHTPFHIDLTCSSVELRAHTGAGPIDVFRSLGLR
ncbi:hypothetical protein Rhe02_79900 [Rhizocola hellebori]|uniref:Crocagin biosynthetic protein CgnE/B domain-containing protein n=1 Tax=Rhizocola hellebori TaxID=1392758 RepID=A0A8J3QIB8_9ACTN|nr:hypothetical protein [Rhizocola hellebori]GIH09923.1 hypothetical protein Rhe02_79900 [Rhizocola hellebori]